MTLRIDVYESDGEMLESLGHDTDMMPDPKDDPDGFEAVCDRIAAQAGFVQIDQMYSAMAALGFLGRAGWVRIASSMGTLEQAMVYEVRNVASLDDVDLTPEQEREIARNLVYELDGLWETVNNYISNEIDDCLNQIGNYEPAEAAQGQ